MKWILAIFLAAAGCVEGKAAAPDSTAASAKPKKISLTQFIDLLGKEKADKLAFKGSIASDLDAPDNEPVRGLEIDESQAFDRAYHAVCLIVEKSANNIPTPVALIFVWQQTIGKDIESRYIKATPHGRLQKAFIQFGKYDDDHKPIRGSAVVNYMDSNSSKAKELLQYELDFWLKARYRQRPTPPR